MIMTSLLLLTVTASPIKIAVMKLNFVEVSEARADFFTEYVSDRFSDQGFEVTSPRAVTTLLGLERQRQLLGCSDESSCIAELAGALGVESVLMGDLAKVGTSYQVNLKILSPQSGKRLAGFAGTAPSEQELVATLNKGVEVLAKQIAVALGRAQMPAPAASVSAPPAEPASGGLRRWWWIPAVVGVAGVAGGVVGLAKAEDQRLLLVNAINISQAQAEQDYSTGVTARTLGFVGVGVGAAALVTSAAFLIFGADSPLTPTAMVHAGGATFSLSGTF
jgi:hypothetical protein